MERRGKPLKSGHTGCSKTPGDEIAISNAVFTCLAVGRMDTIAHEIGHSLGLDDCSNCRWNNLMDVGNIRDVPQSLGPRWRSFDASER